MSEFKYENQGNSTYLVYQVSEDEILDRMSLGMLTNNKIPGIAQTIYTQMDGDRFIKFNISAKISADNVFSGVVNRKRVLGVFKSIVAALIAAEDYMIDPNTVLLDMKYIFADVSTYEAVLIFIPVEKQNVMPYDVKTFFKTVIYNSRFDQTEDCDYIAKIINYLNSAPSFSLSEFMDVLDAIPTSEKAASADGRAGGRSGADIGAAPDLRNSSVLKKEEISSEIPSKPVVEEKKIERPRPVEEKLVQKTEEKAPHVPPVKKREVNIPTSNTSHASSQDEKAISLWYLLQHYNKDNAAAYKRQKEQKKEKKSSAAPKQDAAKKKKAPKAKASAPMGQGFAVPGQNDGEEAFKQDWNAVSVPGQGGASAVAVEVKQISVQPGGTNVSARGEGHSHPVNPVVRAGMSDADFGDTNFFHDEAGDETETVILNHYTPEQQARPHLIRKKNNEQILLNKSVFRIGRDYDFNDYAIVDNKYVGHCHCHILSQDGEYFLVDDNSKNHTLLNGSVLASGTQYKIAHDNIICVADEEFQFKLF